MSTRKQTKKFVAVTLALAVPGTIAAGAANANISPNVSEEPWATSTSAKSEFPLVKEAGGTGGAGGATGGGGTRSPAVSSSKALSGGAYSGKTHSARTIKGGANKFRGIACW